MPRGGKRLGAGAPRGNLNRVKHGQRSRIVARAIEKVQADPELWQAIKVIAFAQIKGCDLSQLVK